MGEADGLLWQLIAWPCAMIALVVMMRRSRVGSVGLPFAYLVGWALWLASLGWTTLGASLGNPNYGRLLIVFVVLGVVLPAALLWALRWAFDGLGSPGRDRP